MKTIETNITVSADGRAVIDLPLPLTVPAGKHRAVVVLDESKVEERPHAAQASSAALPLHDLGPWPENLSLHREDMYDASGR